MSFICSRMRSIIFGSGLNPESASVFGRLRAELPMLVLTMPGQKTVTPMLLPSSSLRSASIMPTTANLEAV
jgi:hypothetical protein